MKVVIKHVGQCLACGRSVDKWPLLPIVIVTGQVRPHGCPSPQSLAVKKK